MDENNKDKRDRQIQGEGNERSKKEWQTQVRREQRDSNSPKFVENWGKRKQVAETKSKASYKLRERSDKRR